MATDSSESDSSNFYDSLEEAKIIIQANAKSRSYEISCKRSHIDRTTDDVRRIDLVCSRRITYKSRSSEKSRNKNSSSIKCSCLWEVRIIKFKIEHSDKWQLCVVNTNHNHSAAKKVFVLSEHRHHELNEILEIIEQSARDKSANIVNRFRVVNSRTIIQFKDIYNFKLRLRRKRLDKYTSTQLLLKALRRNNWFVKFLLKIESKQVSKYSRINSNRTDSEINQKAILRQQACSRHSS